MLPPSLETETLAQQARSDISGTQRRLDRQGAGAAHRVAEISPLPGHIAPAGIGQQGRRQVLLERRLAGLLAVTAPMQGVAGEVERQAGLLPAQMKIDAEVRLARIDRRPPAGPVTEPVDNGILDLERRIMRMVQGGGDQGGIDGKGLCLAQVLLPGELVAGLVERLLIGDGEGLELQQDAAGQTRPEAAAVGGFQVAAECDPGPDLPDLGRAE